MIGRKKKLPFQIYLHTTIYHENPDSTHVSTRVNGWKNETLGGDTRHFEYGYDSAVNIALLRMGGKTTTYRYNALQQLVRENNQAAGKDLALYV